MTDWGLCKRGHVQSPENVRIPEGKSKECRLCHNERQRKYSRLYSPKAVNDLKEEVARLKQKVKELEREKARLVRQTINEKIA